LGAEGRGFESLRPDQHKILIIKAISAISGTHLLFAAVPRQNAIRIQLTGLLALNSSFGTGFGQSEEVSVATVRQEYDDPTPQGLD